MKLKFTDGRDHKGVTISLDYIKESYEQGHRIEAIILTQYLIGHRMNWIFDLITRRNLVAFENWSTRVREAMLKKRSMKEQLDEAGKFLVSSYRFITIANVLFDMGVYDYTLYKGLRRFNNCRNKVAHRLLSALPTQSELGKCFKQGMRLWESIDKIFKEQSALSFGTIGRTSAK